MKSPARDAHCPDRFAFAKADDGRISRRRGVTLQCGQPGQGWNPGCQGVEHQRWSCVASITEIAGDCKIATLLFAAKTCVTPVAALFSHRATARPKSKEVRNGLEGSKDCRSVGGHGNQHVRLRGAQVSLNGDDLPGSTAIFAFEPEQASCNLR